MIPQVQHILQKVNDFGKKDKKKTTAVFSGLRTDEKRFDNLVSESIAEAVAGEFVGKDPEELIDSIVDAGKRYRFSRKDDDLEDYKRFLAAFIKLGNDKTYRVKLIEPKRKPRGKPLEEEAILGVLTELEKRMKVLMEMVVHSQKDIIGLIDDIEGIIVNLRA